MIAVGFARIHLANLINFGVVPLLFSDPDDYEQIDQGNQIVIQVHDVAGEIILRNETRGVTIPLTHCLRPREIAILRAGGALNLATDRP